MGILASGGRKVVPSSARARLTIRSNGIPSSSGEVAAPRTSNFKLEYRINSTNSGIQYRSVELSDVGKWVLKGYQADIDIDNRFTGQIYEERGRGFLALRGQFTRVAPGKKARVQGRIVEFTVPDTPAETARL